MAGFIFVADGGRKMAEADFVKGGCRHCGGHIEFPAAVAGQTVTCPHCGQPTVLEPPPPPGRSRRSGWLGWVVGGAVLILAAGLAGVFFWGRLAAPKVVATENTMAKSAPVTVSNPPVAPVAAPEVVPEPPPREVTNGFAILSYQLEKTPGSSLVYVIGTVRNATARQRFGVKLEFGLYDTNDVSVGSASDYQSILDPHAEWRFKAMVMESKTASVRLRSIADDR
jgi:hypothetical protein